MVKVRAHEIKHALSKKHFGDLFMTEVKNGPTHIANKGELLIMDALAIKKSWANPCIDGYEVKVDRQDFLRDEKWMGYRAYCNRLSFVCPKGLIDPSELPEDIGLIYYNPDKKTLYTKRKALFREIDVSADMLYYILMSKIDSDRHPFFNTQRELIEEYINDKYQRRILGRTFQSKLLQELNKVVEENKENQRKLERYKDGYEEYNKLVGILREFGISAYRWNWQEELKKHLSTNVSPNVVSLVERLKRDTEELDRLMKKAE